MKVSEFVDGLMSAGYWDDNCERCNRVFTAPEGEELCPECAGLELPEWAKLPSER